MTVPMGRGDKYEETPPRENGSRREGGRHRGGDPRRDQRHSGVRSPLESREELVAADVGSVGFFHTSTLSHRNGDIARGA